MADRDRRHAGLAHRGGHVGQSPRRDAAGGASHYSFGTIQPNSQARNSDTYGVLKLTLHSNSYTWQFVPQAGRTYTDGGTTSCH